MAYWGSYLKGLGCLGTALLVKLGGGGGLNELRMADGLMTLMDEMNLNGVSPLPREVLGFGGRGRRRA